MLQIAEDLYNNHLVPFLKKDKLNIAFPDLFASLPDRRSRLSVPLRIHLLKIIEDNNLVNILTPSRTGFDVCTEYYKHLSTKLKVYNGRRVCFIFVENKPVLIDYTEESNWKHCPINDFLRNYGTEAMTAVIKYHCDRSSQYDCPIRVFPFLYPGPNDYRDFPEFRLEAGYKEKDDVFSRLTYFPKYRERFLTNCKNNTFKHSISVFWGIDGKKYGLRRRYSDLIKNIPNSNIIVHKVYKSIPIQEYYENLCDSRFGITIRGSGKFSHRDMELASIGIPFFSENRDQMTFKPFIAGEHYIDVAPQNFLDIFEYYNEHYDEALKIGENGYKYFQDWHSKEGTQKMFKEMCELILHSKIRTR